MSSSEQRDALSAATRRLSQEVAAAEAAVAQSRSRRQTAEAEAALAAKRALLSLSRACEDEALKQLVLAPLPTELIRLVFLLLPADSRLRSREVSRGWYAFLADASLWRVCDLSVRSGVNVRRSPALLEASCARAEGTLEVLDVTGWCGLFDREVTSVEPTLAVLLPVLRSNSESLVALHAQDCFRVETFRYLAPEEIEALLAAAPRLRLLECDCKCDTAAPLSLLEEPQFAPVRLRTLLLDPTDGVPFELSSALAARLAQHPSLSRLILIEVELDAAALEAVVDLAVAQLQHLAMAGHWLTPASLPALTRMLSSRCLTELEVCNGAAPLLVGPSVPAFCTALRASRLTALALCNMRLWEAREDGLALIAACTGHPTLQRLLVCGNELYAAPGRAAIDAALDALDASGMDSYRH